MKDMFTEVIKSIKNVLIETFLEIKILFKKFQKK
jgi:hypothetical protein